MRILAFIIAIFAMISTGAVSVPSASAQSTSSIGGDLYVSGSSPELGSTVSRDVFVTGFSVEWWCQTKANQSLN